MVILRLTDVSVYYGDFQAVDNISLPIRQNEITAFIGPSGCGKSTVLRTINRMNDLIETARVEGEVTYHGVDLYGPEIDPVEVRRHIGIVFQTPNPFPKSIYDNIAFGPKVGGFKGDMDSLVEESLHRAALWDEVKDKLDASAYALSGGQQQRLCMARAIATSPDVLLMDEPASSLDPIATLRIEELMYELKRDYTIVIVTHNMQQAARVSDRTLSSALTWTMGIEPGGSSSSLRPPRCSPHRQNKRPRITSQAVSDRGHHARVPQDRTSPPPPPRPRRGTRAG